MKNLNKLIFPILLILFLLPQIVKADLIVPSFNDFIPDLSLLWIFIVNLVINLFIFGIAYLIFLRKDKSVFNIVKFFLSLILVTIAGLIADTVGVFIKYTTTSTFYNQANAAPPIGILPLIIITFILILIFDMLICKYYLKISLKKSIYIGLWMGILTNPFLAVALGILNSPLAY